MSYDLTVNLIKLFIGLPVVILLAYISLKFTNKYMRKMSDGKFLKVLETVQVFNKAAVRVVKVGNEYHVLGVTESTISQIKVLNEDEVKEFNDSRGILDKKNKRILERK